jgi:hypothetical protein
MARKIFISSTIVKYKTPAINRHIEKQRPGADIEEYLIVFQKETKEFLKHDLGLFVGSVTAKLIRITTRNFSRGYIEIYSTVMTLRAR